MKGDLRKNGYFYREVRLEYAIWIRVTLRCCYLHAVQFWATVAWRVKRAMSAHAGLCWNKW